MNGNIYTCDPTHSTSATFNLCSQTLKQAKPMRAEDFGRPSGSDVRTRCEQIHCRHSMGDMQGLHK